MSLAERKLNHAIREKILALDPTDIRVEYFRPDEGMMILMSKIRALRIDDVLENMGAEDGDTVILDDFEFEYVR